MKKFTFTVTENEEKMKEAVHKMKSAILAVLYHEVNLPTSLYQYCPDGDDSWCQYKRSGENGGQKLSLELLSFMLLKPVFECLSDDKLLERCIPGHSWEENEPRAGDSNFDFGNYMCPTTNCRVYGNSLVDTYNEGTLQVIKCSDCDIYIHLICDGHWATPFLQKALFKDNYCSRLQRFSLIYQDLPKALCGSNNLTPTEATPENQIDAEEETSDQQEEDEDNSESEDEEEEAD